MVFQESDEAAQYHVIRNPKAEDCIEMVEVVAEAYRPK
jgi:hypothetical protein